jgi:hypothetical protein
MSRALNIDATEDHVAATCLSKNVAVSTIETLHSGGTRVVLLNAFDTAAIRKAYGAKVITGNVRRMPTRLMHNY